MVKEHLDADNGGNAMKFCLMIRLLHRDDTVRSEEWWELDVWVSTPMDVSALDLRE